ncbi:hypothetical protein HYX16_04560 [Candidatus Woesearchaeota archaeon]|nr:hypothetical protein [Candidatus Woesearchaeota archaeon]
MNKKGMQYKIILGLVFIMIFIGLFLTFQGKKFQPAEEEFINTEACRSSVLKASQKIPNVDFSPFGVSSLEELQGCKTQKITVKETDKDKVHELLASNIDACWAMFGRGELDFMKDFGGVGDSCFVCSKITFENDIKNLNSGTLIQYIRENPKYKTLSNEKKSTLKIEPFNAEKNKEIYTVIVASRERKLFADISLKNRAILTLISPAAMGLLDVAVLVSDYKPDLFSHVLLASSSVLLNNCQEIS